jgi:hypothetical protein
MSGCSPLPETPKHLKRTCARHPERLSSQNPPMTGRTKAVLAAAPHTRERAARARAYAVLDGSSGATEPSSTASWPRESVVSMSVIEKRCTGAASSAPAQVAARSVRVFAIANQCMRCTSQVQMLQSGIAGCAVQCMQRRRKLLMAHRELQRCTLCNGTAHSCAR